VSDKIEFKGFKSKLRGSNDPVDEETEKKIFRAAEEALDDLLSVFEMDFWQYFDEPLLVYLGDKGTSRSNGVILPGEKNFMKKGIKNSYSDKARKIREDNFPIPKYTIYEELAHTLSNAPADKHLEESNFIQTVILEACGGLGNAHANKILLEDEIKRCEAEIEEIARSNGDEQIRRLLENKQEILELIQYVENEVKSCLESGDEDYVREAREDIGQHIKKVEEDLAVGERRKKTLAHKLISVEIFSQLETHLLNPRPGTGQVFNPKTGKTVSLEKGIELALKLLEEKKEEVQSLQREDLLEYVDDWAETKLKKEEPYFIGKMIAHKVFKENKEAEFIRLSGEEILDRYSEFINSKRRYH